MRKIILGVLLLVMLSSGCAMKAVEVLAAPVDGIERGLSCAEYERMLATAKEQERQYTRRQNKRARVDFHTVLWSLMVFPPVALAVLRDDFEVQLAEAKGRVETLEMLARTCGSDAAPAAPDADTAG
ncbi:MAG: hypothetical protein ISN29_02215 [Gammaproteobacteria bacterium AqS3]|nr:hypothetical protein [Gammaproteobacteria bacterium AqS3]